MSGQPYHAEANDQASLYRMDDGRFQIIRDGALASILTGYGYVLANARVLSALRRAGFSGVDHAAVIFDPTTRCEVTEYREIQVDGEVTPETISATPAGEHLWLHAKRDLFVSAEVRRELGDAFPDLSLSEGFSRFAGQ